MAAFLVPLDAGSCVIPLEKAILLIGRQSDCDVSLTTSRKVSRKHCCIAIVNNTVIVRDLGSTNGVCINGQRINREAPLRLGDELTIGDVRFRLQKEATPATRSQAQTPLAPMPAMPQPPAAAPRAPLPPPVSMDFPVALSKGPLVPPSLSAVRSGSQKTGSDLDFVDSGPLVPYEPTANDFVPLRSDSI
uniref:FHA domain-containing protein n=1 Tax=Schlesneria paludicola TaxID=360056 RepID=A0A7C4QUG9_9PLAN